MSFELNYKYTRTRTTRRVFAEWRYCEASSMDEIKGANAWSYCRPRGVVVTVVMVMVLVMVVVVVIVVVVTVVIVMALVMLVIVMVIVVMTMAVVVVW